MSILTIQEPLASQVRAEAEMQGVNVDALILNALRHYRFQMQQEKIRSEADWWQNVAQEIKERYTGKFVAIHQHQIVDQDIDEQALRQRIRGDYGKTAVLITPAEGVREFHVVSTRL